MMARKTKDWIGKFLCSKKHRVTPDGVAATITSYASETPTTRTVNGTLLRALAVASLNGLMRRGASWCFPSSKFFVGFFQWHRLSYNVIVSLGGYVTPMLACPLISIELRSHLD